MTTWTSVRRCAAVLLLSGAAWLSTVAPAVAQRQSVPLDLPAGPALEGFDVSRLSNAGNGWFDTFHVEQTEPLDAVLEDGRLAGDTPMLVIETAVGALALVRDQMAFHHIAEGRAGGKDWMATF